jgi:hypothetical protein
MTGGAMPPAAIDIDGDSLVVQIEGADKLWAMKSRLEIPLADVVDARVAGDEARGWQGIRVGGTEVPGVIKAGQFYWKGRWVFCDMHHPDKAIAIDLQHEQYEKLLVEVDDPDREVARIRDAAAANPG